MVAIVHNYSWWIAFRQLESFAKNREKTILKDLMDKWLEEVGLNDKRLIL